MEEFGLRSPEATAITLESFTTVLDLLGEWSCIKFRDMGLSLWIPRN